ncbi:MAG: alpha/beta fold hydrolase [Sulfuritalea sp.]|nr:alpha/beta fold hydrolase [Sulfuritalea sp.]MDP1983457.1 alpha/beta fold hydrolase [Sulfuritalea sp.]
MAARQLRWLLFAELLFYTLLGAWLVLRAGWMPLQAAGLGIAGFLGVRLFLVLLSFGLMLNGSSPVPEKLRIGPLQAALMVLEEYVALILLFSVIQPFQTFWLGPDRLGHCATRRTPLLLIHGYQCNRGFWFWLRPRLEAAGWTVATHCMEPTWTEIDNYADGIARRIDEVLAATGAPQLILIGHSMGGLACRAYLRRHGNAKVARMITLGSVHHGTRLASLGVGPNARQMRIGNPWLVALGATDAVPLPPGSVSIFSHHDNYVYPQETGSRLEGAANIAISGVSHIGMAFSPRLLGKLLEVLESP